MKPACIASALLVAALLTLTACVVSPSDLQDQDTFAATIPTPTPTPDIPAIVRALLAQTAVPAPTAAPTPTPDVPATVTAVIAESLRPTPTPMAEATLAPTPPPRPAPTATPEPIKATSDPATATSTPTRATPAATLTGGTNPTLSGLQYGSDVEQRYPDRARQINTLPWVIDGIQGDEKAAANALAHMAIHHWPGFNYVMRLEWIADSRATEEFTLETGSINLPLAGEITVATLRNYQSDSSMLDRLESALRSIETFMNEPLPTEYVLVVYDDAVSGGWHLGAHITINPGVLASAGLLAHEVAHYYFLSGRTWVSEGAANFLQSVAERERIGQDMEPVRGMCSAHRTIRDLEYSPEPDFWCNYSLGERLFHSLYDALGEDDFRRGFTALYRMSQEEFADITVLREAFITPENRHLAEPVIDRWYGVPATSP